MLVLSRRVGEEIVADVTLTNNGNADAATTLDFRISHHAGGDDGRNAQSAGDPVPSARHVAPRAYDLGVDAPLPEVPVQGAGVPVPVEQLAQISEVAGQVLRWNG